MADPVRKFYLIKQHGKTLRKFGYEPEKMSVAELEAAILSSPVSRPPRRQEDDRNANHIDGYDRDDLGESPDF